MLKKFRIFKTAEESEKAEREYYLSLSPEQRLEIAEKLRREYQRIHYGTQQRFRRIFRLVKQA